MLSSLKPHVLEVFSLSGFGQLFQIAECRTVAVHDMTTQTYEDERKTSISCRSFYKLEDGKIIKAVHVVDRLHRRFPRKDADHGDRLPCCRSWDGGRTDAGVVVRPRSASGRAFNCATEKSVVGSINDDSCDPGAGRQP